MKYDSIVEPHFRLSLNQSRKSVAFDQSNCELPILAGRRHWGRLCFLLSVISGKTLEISDEISYENRRGVGTKSQELLK